MAYDAAEMKAYRIQNGLTSALTVPIPVLAMLLDDPFARSVLRRHLGPGVCDAIEKSPKARSEATQK